MTEKNFKTFMYIGAEKMLICVFSKKDSKILYKNEARLTEIYNHIDENKIINFLSKNIFKIEKQLKQFINDISLTINSNQFLSIDISMKQNVYDQVTTKNQLNILNDLKNYILDSYKDYSIIHYVVNHYLFDNVIQQSFNFSKKSNYFCVDATFILMKKEDIFFYKKIFEKFQISIKKIMCGKYIFDIFRSNDFNECEMGLKISLGFNSNEIFLVKKNIENKGFFERFFHFFS